MTLVRDTVSLTLNRGEGINAFVARAIKTAKEHGVIVTISRGGHVVKLDQHSDAKKVIDVYYQNKSDGRLVR
ncbi:MAG: hypothetical protein LBQ49_02570 [Rickettsiales bacterium]|jgi:hypothetical protein|nr:hypothetical protein [Rickettsiales bacterium]